MKTEAAGRVGYAGGAVRHHDLDTEAGISENVTYFTVAPGNICRSHSERPQSRCLALIKLLQPATRAPLQVLVNMAKDSEEALEFFANWPTCRRFLDISLDYLGCVSRMKKS